jgi:hypothetical protein
MNRLVAVHGPAAAIGDTLFISVELWTGGVIVHLARVRNEETDRLTAEHEAAIAAWRKGDEFPEAPDAGFGRDLALADDVGTRYQTRGGQAGGTGTEWRAMWQFAPGVPDSATRLTVSRGGDVLELEL